MKFNLAPYNDDFSEDNNFYSVLYKPGYEVQARELNTMQSILQNQIASVGNHLFKNGAKINGCSSTFLQYDYVRLNDTFDSFPVVLTPYNNKQINLIGAVSKVEATIIDIVEKTEDDSPYIALTYTKTGIDNEQTTFIPGEDVEFYDENDVLVYTATVRCPTCPGNETSDEVPPVGKSLLFNIEEGTFYYNGYFVKLQGHHIIIDKYLTKDENGAIVSGKTYRIGLKVTEDVITVEQDTSLFDPHLGYPNEAAEGADRYKISLSLEMREYSEDESVSDFILIARVRQNHTVEYKKDDTDYNEIMKELARRTFETSGNFTVIPWKARFLNEKKFDEKDAKGWTPAGLDENFVAVIQPGSGYVKGYRTETSSDSIVKGRKARDTKKLRGAAISFDGRANITVTVSGNVSWINHTGTSTLTDQVFNIYDVGSVSIGSFKVYDIQRLTNTTYKIYLYDITLVAGKTLSMAASVKPSDNSFVGTLTDGFGLDSANNKSLIFPLGYKSIKSLRDNNNYNNGNTSIQVKKRLSGILDSNGSITFNSNSNEIFISPSSTNTICWVGNNPTGTTVLVTSSNSSYTGTSLTLNLGATHASKNVSYITSINKTSQQENTKTLTRHSYTTNSKPGASVNDILVLPHADGYRIESIQLISISDSSKNIDVKSEYEFLDGQTDNFYGPSKIKRNVARIIGNDDRLIITYYYFEHSGTAGFFTVDSYAQLVNDEELNLEYSDIPTYTDVNGNKTRLAECIDFRSIKLSTVVDTFATIPTFNSTMIFDIEYYLPRSDLLLLNSKSKFYFKEGIPSDAPHLPTVDEDAMALYEVYLEAYTYSLDDIKIKYVDNKRFTMKDISKIENRISNIEYSVALTMLEQQTLNMSIKDQDGFDRYKNGFLVDNFKGYYAADITNDEFKASLDRNKGHLRPQFKQNNVKLKFDPATSTNLKLFGNMAICNYNHDLFITNPFATQTLSINPYMIFRKTGTMTLSPNIDSWADDRTLPEMITTIDGGVEALRDVADAAKLLGTDYSSWIDFNTSIIGTEVNSVTTRVNPLRDETTTTTSTTSVTDSRRTATTRSIGTETQSYTIDDIVKDVAIIPYIRSNIVQFYASNLKPNTRVYAYFDGQNVSAHCKKIAQISSNNSQSVFGANPLITDASGNISGEFRIPGSTFFTGEKKFVLTNDPNNSGNQDVETCRAEAVYFAAGIAQTKQSSTLNVITPTFNTKSTVENRSSTSVSREVSVTSIDIPPPVPPIVPAPIAVPEIVVPVIPFQFVWIEPSWWQQVVSRDPIAQAFKVDNSCFISKVGVYFSEVDMKSDIVWFEIREMINGYPGVESIAHKEVKAASLLPFVSVDASKEYQVEFSIPTYVDANKSYAFVIGGFSPDTRVFISKLGDKLLNEQAVLEQPPLPYTMFRSLNGETWNAEQFTTMKINIYRAVFDAQNITLNFYNNTSFKSIADKNPIEVETGSNKVRVYVKNHGLRVNDKIILDFAGNTYYELQLTSGIPQIGQTITSTSCNGIVKDIRINALTTKYEIAVDWNEGSFQVADTYTCAARTFEYLDEHVMSEIGVSNTAITQNVATGSITAVINNNPVSTISGASISLFAKEHTVKYIDSADSFIIEVTGTYTDSGRFGGSNVIVKGTNIKYDMMNISGQYLSYNSNDVWNTTLNNYGSATTKQYNVVPVADNYLDQPAVVISKDGIKSLNLSVSCRLSSPYISPVFNTDSISATLVSNRIENLSSTVYEVAPNAIGRLLDETDALFGSESFKYVSIKANLENPATDMRVIFDVLCGANSDFDVYVKLYNAQDSQAESDVDWIKFDKYNKVGSNSSSFTEYDLQLSTHCTLWDENVEYVSYRVKLVGKSENSSRPVIFQNLRAIALT